LSHRRALYLSLLLFVGNALFGQQPGSPVPITPSITEERAVAANSPLTKSITAVIDAVGSIKAGMTRADLLTVFTEEGGLSSRTQRTYVYRLCPYVKVDVEFTPITNPDDHLTELSNDKILKISRPYLQYSIAD
jgi:hypothetical protein